MSIAKSIDSVHAAVAQAAIAAGRTPDSVQVLAATKTQPVEALREALFAGQILMAENRAQALRDKAPLLAANSPPPQWHFIGRLQKNKVKYVVPWAKLIHTVDNLALAEAISNKSPGPMGVLIQVNTGGDTAKGGVAPKLALDLAKDIAGLDKLTVRGFMTMPPMTENVEDCAPFFSALADLGQQGLAAGLKTEVLSMGMSRDYAVAIRCGATLVRIGTAIFGTRN
jgi:pyridoxal phosphate enzyme (YggS family)